MTRNQLLKKFKDLYVQLRETGLDIDIVEDDVNIVDLNKMEKALENVTNSKEISQVKHQEYCLLSLTSLRRWYKNINY